MTTPVVMDEMAGGGDRARLDFLIPPVEEKRAGSMQDAVARL
ncbi:MAG: hypothetical protein U1F59_11370 [Candidatus Competibacteraceae bacterium]